MRLPQLQRPAAAAVMAAGYRPVLSTFTLPVRPAIQSATTARSPCAIGNSIIEGRRYASVKSQGAYRIPNKKTIAKKLGAKKSGDQFVIPGNIIFKQRGTIWHPGQNALRGRDHTIHAAATGYVKYYRDPELHPNRQYIGVAFNRDDVLPYPRNEPRRRKLGMVAHTRKPRPALATENAVDRNITASGLPRRVVREGGLVDLEKLEASRWSRDKKRELEEARTEAQKARHAKKNAEASQSPDAASAPASETAVPKAVVGQTQAAPTSTTEKKAAASATAGGKKKVRPSKRKLVSPLAYVQKRWLERRKTKELVLNPRNYAYMESNAAIGRLVSRTMYRAPWELGGRKARFRSRRQKREQRITQIKENKAFVAREKERERIAEEKARQKKLEQQRARGAGKGGKAEKAEGQPKEANKSAESKNPAAEVKPVEAKKPAQAGKPTET